MYSSKNSKIIEHIGGGGIPTGSSASPITCAAGQIACTNSLGAAYCYSGTTCPK